MEHGFNGFNGFNGFSRIMRIGSWENLRFIISILVDISAMPLALCASVPLCENLFDK
ncbi:MAG: hypothetical protein FWG87_08350 [Defluviitaleaceae bacterium]|nr:hypothetical protein [Defluviitaleaceae bacterium]